MTHASRDPAQSVLLHKPRLMVLSERAFPVARVRGFQNKQMSTSHFLLDKAQARGYVECLGITIKDEYRLHAKVARSGLPELLTHEERVRRIESLIEEFSTEMSLNDVLDMVYSTPFFVLQ